MDLRRPRRSGLRKAKLAPLVRHKGGADMSSFPPWSDCLAGCECIGHGVFCLRHFRREKHDDQECCAFHITRLPQHLYDWRTLPTFGIFYFTHLALSHEFHHRPALEAREGFAGSGPLAVPEMLASRHPDHHGVSKIRGRWTENMSHLDEREANAVTLHWHPTDADHFIAEDSKHRFEERVEVIVENLRQVLSLHNRTIRHVKTIRSVYAIISQPIWIRNYEISGLSMPLSFVQAPCCDTMQDVVEGFDINVARVIYDPASTGCLVVNSNTLESIRAGQATVEPFPVRPEGPSEFDAKKICSTIKRMHGHGPCQRGHRFVNHPTFLIDVNRRWEGHEPQEVGIFWQHMPSSPSSDGDGDNVNDL